jgi:phosphoserine phosphatase
MARKLIPIAIAYDFDGTLAPGNMQERDFIPKINMTKQAFWTECNELSKKHEADNILVYMGQMLQKAAAAEVTVREEDFAKYGASLELFAGVDTWFERINAYGKESGIKVEHFIISSGIREMIGGTKIASQFKQIFASSFWYDHHGVAKWPALALNYTTKTQYLFRINKGSLHVYDHSIVNEYVPLDERAVPFENMIFIGDGETDIPCFSLLRDQGGHPIAVYKPHARKAKQRAEKLIRDRRVNHLVPADYSENGELDRTVKAIIDKIASDNYLKSLSTSPAKLLGSGKEKLAKKHAKNNGAPAVAVLPDATDI